MLHVVPQPDTRGTQPTASSCGVVAAPMQTDRTPPPPRIIWGGGGLWPALKTDKMLYLMRCNYKACVTPTATVIGKFLLPASCWFLALLILRSWRWKRRIPQKHRLTFNELHSIICQKTELITTDMRTSNPTSWLRIFVVFLNPSRQISECFSN
jgi:hypothetical protein